MRDRLLVSLIDNNKDDNHHATSNRFHGSNDQKKICHEKNMATQSSKLTDYQSLTPIIYSLTPIFE